MLSVACMQTLPGIIGAFEPLASGARKTPMRVVRHHADVK
jgi:hypothetical protein